MESVECAFFGADPKPAAAADIQCSEPGEVGKRVSEFERPAAAMVTEPIEMLNSGKQEGAE